MKTLNIWEVRAEAGKKEPHLDVSANVAADTFLEALTTLIELIEERAEAHVDVKEDDYEIVCVRLLQQVITLEPTTPCPESLPFETSAP